ncbi:unnamed protein product [Rotaria sp. Silwood1]|nr:unnamed protein product [Rotaria sp. Silwood1]CAF4052848.1 unnamed protein product [Rotaria sp. Silwood1]CAF4994572.1 unnamed protein product [Rotaria sp. Silwood1]CAF5016159.1 unnamed protein product [Rotaria sp. Silwood1]CAF5042188.1 unnamed protein product [Rotaria sp. Silwood1]
MAQQENDDEFVVDINGVKVKAKGWERVAATAAVIIGNTVGSIIPYKCPHCGTWSRVSSYGGNVVQGGATCPSCGRDVFGG